MAELTWVTLNRTATASERRVAPASEGGVGEWAPDDDEAGADNGQAAPRPERPTRQMLAEPTHVQAHVPLAGRRRQPPPRAARRLVTGATQALDVQAEGSGLAAAVVNVPAEFRVHVRDLTDGSAAVHLKPSDVHVSVRSGPGSPSIQVAADQSSPGTFVVQWSVPLSGTYTLAVHALTVPCEGSPFTATVEAPITTAKFCHAKALSTKAVGTHFLYAGQAHGSAGSASSDVLATATTQTQAKLVAGLIAEVAITARDQSGNKRLGPAAGDRFAAEIRGPSRVTNGKVTNDGNGNFTLEYVPRIAGFYSIDIYVLPHDYDDAKTIAAVKQDPPSFLVSPLGWKSRHDHPAQPVTRIVAGENKGGAESGDAGLQLPDELRIGSGTIEVEVLPTVAHPPMGITVGEGACASIAGKHTSFKICMRDRFGNMCRTSAGTVVAFLVPRRLYEEAEVERCETLVSRGNASSAVKRQQRAYAGLGVSRRKRRTSNLESNGAYRMSEPPKALTAFFDPRQFVGVHEIQIKDNFNGSYDCWYNVSVADTYDLVIYLNDALCLNMRHDVVIVPATPYALNCTISPARECTEHQAEEARSLGRGEAKTTVAGEEVIARIRPFDVFGNERPDFGMSLDGEASLECRVELYRANAEIRDEPPSLQIQPPKIHVHPVSDDDGHGPPERPGEHEYVLTWTSAMTGSFLLHVTIDGEPIAHAPFLLTVRGNVIAPHMCEAVGSGLAQSTAGETTKLVIIARDEFGNMTPYHKAKDGRNNFAIKALIKAHDIPFTGNLVGPKKELAKGAMLAQIIMRGRAPPAEGRISLSIHRAGISIELGDEDYMEPLDNRNRMLKREKDAIFAASYIAMAAGTYQLDIQCNGIDIKGTPYYVDVRPNLTCNWQCELSGGYKAGSAGRMALFTISAMDRFNNCRWKGGDGFRVRLIYMYPLPGPLGSEVQGDDDESLVRIYDPVLDAPVDVPDIEAEVRDNSDGTYLISYRPRIAGFYELEISLDGHVVRKEETCIRPDHVAGNRCSIVGLGSLRSICGVQTKFRLITRDAYGNRVGEGGRLVDASIKVMNPDVIEAQKRKLRSVRDALRFGVLGGQLSKTKSSKPMKKWRSREPEPGGLGDPRPLDFWMCGSVEPSKKMISSMSSVLSDEPAEVTDLGDGTYEIRYTCYKCTTDPARPMLYRIVIDSIDTNPCNVYCEPTLYPAAVDPSQCVLVRRLDDEADDDVTDDSYVPRACTDAAPPLRAGENAPFLIEARDAFGNLRHIGGEHFIVGLVRDDTNSRVAQGQRAFGDGLLPARFGASDRISGGVTNASGAMVRWASVRDIGRGWYLVDHRQLCAGAYHLTASHISGDSEVGRSSNTFHRETLEFLSSGARPEMCLLSGANLKQCNPHQLSVVHLLLRDDFGNPAYARRCVLVPEKKSDPSEIEAESGDEGDGSGSAASGDCESSPGKQEIATLNAFLLDAATGEEKGIVALQPHGPHRGTEANVDFVRPGTAVDAADHDRPRSAALDNDVPATQFKLMFQARELGALRLEVLVNGVHAHGSPLLLDCVAGRMLEDVEHFTVTAPTAAIQRTDEDRAQGVTFPRRMLEKVEKRGVSYDVDSTRDWSETVPLQRASVASAAQGPFAATTQSANAAALLQAFGLKSSFDARRSQGRNWTDVQNRASHARAESPLGIPFGALDAHMRWRRRTHTGELHAGIYRMARAAVDHAALAEADYTPRKSAPRGLAPRQRHLSALTEAERDAQELALALNPAPPQRPPFPLPLSDIPTPYRRKNASTAVSSTSKGTAQYDSSGAGEDASLARAGFLTHRRATPQLVPSPVRTPIPPGLATKLQAGRAQVLEGYVVPFGLYKRSVAAASGAGSRTWRGSLTHR